MRKPDTEIITEYFVGVFTKGVKYGSEKTGLGSKTETAVLPKDLDPAQHLQHEAADVVAAR